MGGGGFAKRWSYLISLFSKSDDKGGGGSKYSQNIDDVFYEHPLGRWVVGVEGGAGAWRGGEYRFHPTVRRLLFCFSKEIFYAYSAYCLSKTFCFDKIASIKLPYDKAVSRCDGP